MIQARIRRQGQAGFTLDAEFTAAPGITAVFGPRGAGKTLLLETVAGLVRPEEGRILVQDQILFDRAAGVDLPPRLRPCAYLPADGALFPHMTVRDNLLFAAASRRLPRLEQHRRVNELLDRFGLAGASTLYPREAAHGDQQRAVIARALVGQPKLMLIDCPAGELDAPRRSEWRDLLRMVRSEFGVSMLLAARALEDCFELGDEMLVLLGGKLAQAGPPRQVVHQPAGIEVARALGGYNLWPAEIVVLDPARRISRLRLAGGELAGPYFPGRLRGDRVTLCVRPAELTAVPASGRAGPNQIAARLVRVTELAERVRLQFEGEIAVELAQAEFEKLPQSREWLVEFRPESLRAL